MVRGNCQGWEQNAPAFIITTWHTQVQTSLWIHQFKEKSKFSRNFRQKVGKYFDVDHGAGVTDKNRDLGRKRDWQNEGLNMSTEDMIRVLNDILICSLLYTLT